MTVRKLLAEQDKGFVSLHEVLTKMMDADEGCSVEDAAALLYRLLSKGLLGDAPAWHMYDRAHGTRRAGKITRAWELLRSTSESGWESPNDIPF